MLTKSSMLARWESSQYWRDGRESDLVDECSGHILADHKARVEAGIGGEKRGAPLQIHSWPIRLKIRRRRNSPVGVSAMARVSRGQGQRLPMKVTPLRTASSSGKMSGLSVTAPSSRSNTPRSRSKASRIGPETWGHSVRYRDLAPARI